MAVLLGIVAGYLLGTVAGDDTIILVCAESSGGGSVAADLATLAGLSNDR